MSRKRERQRRHFARLGIVLSPLVKAGGRPVSFEDLRHQTNLTEGDTRELLNDLASRRVIAPVFGGTARYGQRYVWLKQPLKV